MGANVSNEHAYQQGYNGGYGPGVKVIRTVVNEPYPYGSGQGVYMEGQGLSSHHGSGCPCHHHGLHDIMTSHQSSSGMSMMGSSSNYAPPVIQPTSHEFDRVVLNPPTVGCSKPSTPSTPKFSNGSYANVSSSCSKGCDSAQFVLESAPPRQYWPAPVMKII